MRVRRLSRRLSRSHGWSAFFTLILFIHVGQTRPTRAQTVSGTVVDSIASTPVPAGFVVLLDASGRELVRDLVRSDGSFEFRSLPPGTYRIRSERIGYRATETQAFQLAQGQLSTQIVRVVALPRMLSAVEVTAQTSCETNPGSARATALVWDEIRKALAATTWDGSGASAIFRKYGYVRLRDPNLRLQSESGQVTEGVANQPYQSLPAERLAVDGYIQVEDDAITYSIPGVDVILHDSFLSTHCFRVTRDNDRPTEVGLAFEPENTSRDRIDVRGTLWLQEATWELTSLHIRYTDLPGDIDAQYTGGKIEFFQLPSGAWIVQQWELRTPVLEMQNQRTGRLTARRVPVAIGYRDIGSEVVEVTANGEAIVPRRLAILEGQIVDSVTRSPMFGAHIRLGETGFQTTTDAEGRFRLGAALEGDYSVGITHPRLDSAAFVTTRDVSLTRSQTRHLSVQLPPLESVVGSTCPAPTDPNLSGTLVGVVRSRPRMPATETTVVARWQRIETDGRRLTVNPVKAEVKTDDWGIYRLCDLPIGQSVVVRAELGNAFSGATEIVFPAIDTGQTSVTSASVSHGLASHPVRTPWFWREDLILRTTNDGLIANDAGVPSFSVFVLDDLTSAPLPGVTIRLNTGDSLITDSRGLASSFEAPILAGSNLVMARRIGYAPWIRNVWLPTDQRLAITVRMAPQGFALAPIEVTAEAVDARLTEIGFYHRQRYNNGVYMDRKEIEKRLGRAQSVPHLLSGISRVTVVSNTPGVIGSTVLFGCGRPPRVILDGFEVTIDSPQSFDELVRPEDIMAMEIYRTPSQIPIEYGGTESACGVLVIWTMR